MLIIMTNVWEYRTTDTKESIQKKVEETKNNQISFQTTETTVEIENWLNECVVTMTLDLSKVVILWFKEFNVWKPVIQETELKNVEKKYNELWERFKVLKDAFDTPEFNEILKDERSVKERKLAYHEKLKEQDKK